MIELEDKKYRLEEAYVFDEADVDFAYGELPWDDGHHYVDVATHQVKVKRAWVLVEVES